MVEAAGVEQRFSDQPIRSLARRFAACGAGFGVVGSTIDGAGWMGVIGVELRWCGRVLGAVRSLRKDGQHLLEPLLTFPQRR